MRIYPITISYEGTAFFAQNKDCEYAMNKLLFDNSNETIDSSRDIEYYSINKIRK